MTEAANASAVHLGFVVRVVTTSSARLGVVAWVSEDRGDGQIHC